MKAYLVVSTEELRALVRFAETQSPEPGPAACLVLSFDVYTQGRWTGQAHNTLVRTPAGAAHRLNHATMTHHPAIT